MGRPTWIEGRSYVKENFKLSLISVLEISKTDNQSKDWGNKQVTRCLCVLARNSMEFENSRNCKRERNKKLTACLLPGLPTTFILPLYQFSEAVYISLQSSIGKANNSTVLGKALWVPLGMQSIKALVKRTPQRNQTWPGHRHLSTYWLLLWVNWLPLALLLGCQ